MYQWLGWVFIVIGGLITLMEVIIHLQKTLRKSRADISGDIPAEIIKKLPWMVILGLLLIYLGLYIVGVPVPFSIAIGNPTS